jgi:hypothetical protein
LAEKTFTGTSLEQALKDDEFQHSGIELVGMVKASEKPGHVGFSRSGCESWIDLPTNLIEQAEQLRQQVCEDHSYPVFKITLKEPKDPEARLLSALLATPMPNRSQHEPHSAPTWSSSADRMPPGFQRSSSRLGPRRHGAAGPTYPSPATTARMGAGGFGVGPGRGLSAWGCWDSECCDCVHETCYYTGVEEVNGGVMCVCDAWECEPCEKCIWPW